MSETTQESCFGPCLGAEMAGHWTEGSDCGVNINAGLWCCREGGPAELMQPRVFHPLQAK